MRLSLAMNWKGRNEDHGRPREGAGSGPILWMPADGTSETATKSVPDRRFTMFCAKEVMTTKIFSVAPETTIREAAELLAKEQVSGLPVLDGGRLVGIVSEYDLLP